MVRRFHSKVDPFDLVLYVLMVILTCGVTQRFAHRERGNMWCQCAAMVGGYKAHLVENVGVSQSSFPSRTSQSRHMADLRSSNVMERKHGNCAINSEFLISWEIMIQCVGRRSSFYETISALTHKHTHTQEQ